MNVHLLQPTIGPSILADIGIFGKIGERLSRGYQRLLDYPRLLLATLAVVLAVAGYYATQFDFDASADTLVVRGDPDLTTYLRVSERFGGDDFLLMTFHPNQGDALAPDNLETLGRLENELEDVDGVKGVFSILDAPLLQSPPVPVSDLANGYHTLRSPGVDLSLARKELTGSPLFENLLITPDAATSAMRIDLAIGGDLASVDRERAELRTRQRRLHAHGDTLPGEELARLAHLDTRHDALREAYVARRAAVIERVRDIRDRYRRYGVLYLGGVPMIAADMITFVKNDLMVFGSSVVAVIMVVLYLFFHQRRWVVLPILTSAITVLITMGILGAAGKPATVVSSNFVSLLAIITISLTIHLIVRYRELQFREPDLSDAELTRQTMTSKFAPCLYNALTTMVAFGSLLSAHIVPVEDFGMMMCLGIAVGMVVTFWFFPAVLLLLHRPEHSPKLVQEFTFTRVLGQWARWRYVAICSIGLAASAAAVYGITRVSMENRFLDYFRKDTEIYQGMHFVDRHLGGTVPFDVVLQFEPYQQLSTEDDFFTPEEEAYPQRYWFTRDKLDRVLKVHRYLQSRPEVGKVLSVSSLDLVARQLTDGKPLSSAEVAGVLGALPDDLRGELIRPYADPETGQFRISARVIESGHSFDRAALAKDIQQFAVEQAGFEPDQVTVTGMMVMFDNMLKQLFSSQVNTLVWVLLATLAMFLILLRSLKYAVLGVVPNILAAASVIAFMGYVGIPLDLMTITIAAIAVGIGVDDAIHYLHRFREERDREPDVRLAVAWSHATIGRAMYFTSITVIVGFSVLVLSNFVPTTLFGMLTAVAMALALIANLLLLPSMLVLFLAAPRRELPVR